MSGPIHIRPGNPIGTIDEQTTLAFVCRSKQVAEQIHQANGRPCVFTLQDSNSAHIAEARLWVGRFPGSKWVDGETGDTLHTPCRPFDLEAAGVGDLLRSKPTPRRFLIENTLPRGVVALHAAAGATGKSLSVLQLAVALATGCDWLGLPVSERASTLILAAEDDRGEIHRRLLAIVDHHWPDVSGYMADARQRAIEAIERCVFVIDRVGEDNRLTAQIDREMTRTAMAQQIIDTAQAMPQQPGLIVLDPLARFDGGDPNLSDHATRIIEAAEAIRKATEATILLPHHVNKASMKDSDAGQEAIRGSSGLVDGARWVSLMATLRRDESKRYGIQPEDASNFVSFRVVKGNYGPPLDLIWLKREQGGVLAPTRLYSEKEDKHQQKRDARYQSILDGVVGLIRRHGPMTAYHIRREYGGSTGVLSADDKSVRAALKRAVEEQALIEVGEPGRRGRVLELPKGSE